MTASIQDRRHLQGMLKALRSAKVFHIQGDSRSGYVVTHPASNQEVFRAMPGSDGTYLVRHHLQLFA